MRPYRMAVDAVISGQEAINIIAEEAVHYDAVFMDHMMPGMDGMEATKRIRNLGTEYARTIPIIALTANALPENEELFLKNGFNAFMAKPIDVNILNQVLINWVRDEEKEKHLTAAVLEDEEHPQTGILTNFTIEGVDLAAGAAQFGGEASYLEIVKVFVHDTPKLLKNIQTCLDGFRIMPAAAAAALEDLKNYTITVHGIKGSCYGICAAAVGDLAKELEVAAKAQDLGKVMNLNNRFVQTAGQLVEELKILFPKKENKPKLEKKSPDPQLLQKLLDAARSFNINTMFTVLDELELYRYEQNGKLIQQLREAADNYEYTDVIGLLGSGEAENEARENNAG
ncbi:hypothetical protein AGMMS50230_08160 [Spirochaetia bacterium]|nr:hypothetical protein AGMMS50230_08160 [Spirochaetia bacterium]